MAGSRRDLETEVVKYCRLLHERGWVANHDGNITAHLNSERFVATPTAVSKGAVTRDMLIVVDQEGRKVSGRYGAFSELALHMFIYRTRPDVRAVIHSHAPYATGFAVAGVPIQTTMMAEPVVSLGETIPLIPYALPKTADWTLNMAGAVDDADALLLQNHGVITFGPDLETAFLRMELVEHLARIQLVAHQAGGVMQLPEVDVDVLLQARTRAGLGKAARS